MLLLAATLDVSGEKKTSDSTTIYIRKFSEFFYVKTIISSKIFALGFQDLSTSGPKMEFKPNLGTYMGFGVNMFDLTVDFIFRTKSNPEEIYKYGKSTGQDLQLHIYSRKFGIDLGYQDYKGFYLNNPRSFFPKWTASEPYPRQDDMTARTMYLGLFYVFKPERFSFPSVFNHTEAQLKSGGSWLLSGSVNQSRIQDPVSIVMKVDTNNLTGLNNLRYVEVSSINALPGYSYNIVVKQKFYLNFSLALGFGYQSRSYTSESTYHDNSIYMTNTWRAGLGYNGRRFFAGMSGYTSQTGYKIQNLEITSQGGFFRFFLGYRFREWGFMQKSIFDLFSSKKKHEPN